MQEFIHAHPHLWNAVMAGCIFANGMYFYEALNDRRPWLATFWAIIAFGGVAGLM